MLLVAKQLTKSILGKKIVNELSFEVAKGEVVGLLGPNGAGKTTTFYMTMGLSQPDSGEIFFNNHSITNKTVDQRALCGIGYLSQEPSIFRGMSVIQNILCILETMPLSQKECLEEAMRLLNLFHLNALAHKKSSTLSGGERRRLEIARALARRPSLLLFDEPFAAIDPITLQDVKALISTLKQQGIAILITDHNAREIFSIVDRAYLLMEGKLLAHGSVETILNDPVTRQYYLGSDFQL